MSTKKKDDEQRQAARPYPILFQNYDYTEEGANETSPGGGLYHGDMGKYKSVKEFIEKRRKKNDKVRRKAAIQERINEFKKMAEKEEHFKKYKRTDVAELRPYIDGEKLNSKVSISEADEKAGSPKIGDMIARNPKNHDDQWLVAKKYFLDNFEKVK